MQKTTDVDPHIGRIMENELNSLYSRRICQAASPLDAGNMSEPPGHKGNHPRAGYAWLQCAPRSKTSYRCAP